jgi:hypothetical protein
MNTATLVIALALVSFAVVGTASADPTTVSQCQADPAGLGTACATATVDVQGDCTRSCTIVTNVDGSYQ